MRRLLALALLITAMASVVLTVSTFWYEHVVGFKPTESFRVGVFVHSGSAHLWWSTYRHSGPLLVVEHRPMDPGWTSRMRGFAGFRFWSFGGMSGGIGMPMLIVAGTCAGGAWRLTRRRFAPGMCARCGYDLRASPERCPECGDRVAAAKSDR